MKQQRSVILIRGLPGAGKSTLAALLSEEGKYPVFSVDDYFTAKDGTYEFLFADNHLAYLRCSENTRAAMINEVPKIFVDNTFTMDWEMEPYFKMAEELKYQVIVITVENRHGGKNIHNISDEQITKMVTGYKIVLH